MSMMDVEQLARHRGNEWVDHYLCWLRDALDHPIEPAGRLLPVHECNARLARFGEVGDRWRERVADVSGVTSNFAQVLSDDAVYEYRADRWWAEGPRLAFVGCNPSMIDWQAGARLDPTSANCEVIARREGYAGMTMLNLWAVRATDPRGLLVHSDPVGPGWAAAFDEAVRDAGVVVVAWGNAPFEAGTQVARRRIVDVVGRLAVLGLEVHCVGQTTYGEPRHLSLRGVSRGALPALQPFLGRTTRP